MRKIKQIMLASGRKIAVNENKITDIIGLYPSMLSDNEKNKQFAPYYEIYNGGNRPISLVKGKHIEVVEYEI